MTNLFILIQFLKLTLTFELLQLSSVVAVLYNYSHGRLYEEDYVDRY